MSKSNSITDKQNRLKSQMNRQLNRPRRLRTSSNIRNLSTEKLPIPVSKLIYPVFIQDGKNINTEISAMPDQFRTSIDVLLKKIPSLINKGIVNLALFPKINDSLKNSSASEAINPKGFLPSAIKELKSHFPEVSLYTDIALDPFSSDGHDGLVQSGKILNDETVRVLTEMALMHADSGADFVCPSDMMDGRIKSIRSALEENNYTNTGIISYTAKYASAFYGPFRTALDSAPKSGDKKTYQMDFMNSKEALKEAQLDSLEGADVLMVKPALSYLDVISLLKRKALLPVAAYNVSGEYAMVKATAKNGWIDEEKIIFEILNSIYRAGADIIFTYHAEQYADIYKKQIG